MQFLILSDIHANWYALQAVLESAGGPFGQIICCGDLVGYNPHPGAAINWTREHCNIVVRGNHDKVACGIEQLDWFNPIAQTAAKWTRSQLSEAEIDYLRGLQVGPVKLDHFHLWHGAPFDEDEYIIRPREAAACFPEFELPLAFFGHTHLQGGFYFRRSRVAIITPVPADYTESVLQLEPDTLYLVNPGSVGQPRDGDPRAAYAVYDSDQRTVEFRRVAYPIEKTAQDIREAGLPDALAARLYKGV
ncbi:MAG: metallophosphoesterase family protein [Bryobacteraceae bacterium]